MIQSRFVKLKYAENRIRMKKYGAVQTQTSWRGGITTRSWFFMIYSLTVVYLISDVLGLCCEKKEELGLPNDVTADAIV